MARCCGAGSTKIWQRAFLAILERQSVFQSAALPALSEAIETFHAQYMESPYRANRNGSRFNNLLWLFVLARAYRPTAIIDSGTFTGASAWALALGAPDVEVHSFDVDMSQLIARTPGVVYHEHDWTAFDLAKLDLSRGLVYFDDHVDQVRRLVEASEAELQFAIFDDDFPVGSFAPMAHGGFSLPKIEFVLDQRLRGETEIAWIEGGKRYVWPIDVERLDKAARLIGATDRVANLSAITGIWQTPYRIVSVLAKPA